ncbi:MAG: lipoyl(octanoyl) transferase LipB [Deltaproteobacteria bacterium]
MPACLAMNKGHRKCGVMKSGLVSYQYGLTLQDKAKLLVTSGEWDGIIILLQHLPVITVGNSGGKENFLFDPQELESSGIQIVHAERGGNITCHNSGQLVGYPVLDLNKWCKDVHWYVQMLEETLIHTLAEFGLKSGRKARYSGVWVEDDKIAALDVSVRRWLTRHGFALNVDNDLKMFDAVVPCGIKEFGVTSMHALGFATAMEQVIDTYLNKFSEVFQCELTFMR